MLKGIGIRQFVEWLDPIEPAIGELDGSLSAGCQFCPMVYIALLGLLTALVLCPSRFLEHTIGAAIFVATGR
jgi:hypothetical protein